MYVNPSYTKWLEYISLDSCCIFCDQSNFWYEYNERWGLLSEQIDWDSQICFQTFRKYFDTLTNIKTSPSQWYILSVSFEDKTGHKMKESR